MSRIKIKPLTVALIVLAALATVAGFVYFMTAATSLPTFFPGHDAPGEQAHEARHRDDRTLGSVARRGMVHNCANRATKLIRHTRILHLA